jgi:hypothetical protein
VNEEPGVVGEPSVLVWSDIALLGAAGLGMLSIVLAGVAAYLVIRHQGYFYAANVRSTHVDDQEVEPGDR